MRVIYLSAFGFDVTMVFAQGRKKGLGLAGIRERRNAAGGTLHIDSGPAEERNCWSKFRWRNEVPIRVVLADDHVLVRQGLKALLERESIHVSGEASDGHEAVRLVMSIQPDVAIFDVGMPILNGIEAAREVHKCSPGTRTILLTRHDEDQYIIGAFRAGTKGYVLKSQAAPDLIDAIQHVCRGRVYLSPNVSAVVVEAFLSKTDPPSDPLTSRQRQVLQLVGEGKSTKEIASLLTISEKTAESHRVRLMQKLDIHDTASLVRYAIRHGLLQP